MMGGWTSFFTAFSKSVPLCLSQSATALYFRVEALSKVGMRGYHSEQKVVDQNAMKIRILPALSDNYMYLLMDLSTKEAAVVDPVEPDSVIKAVEEEGVTLTTLLTTHHHWDHSGGNGDLIKRVPGLTVLGGDDRIDGITKKVQHGDTMTLGSISIQCLFTPCHTSGHICYFVTKDTDMAVFTGDTLFLGGCGRFFEGTAPQMYDALVNVLGKLPGDTKVYCGHEYSLQNLAFGAHVEPDNQHIKEKIEWCKSEREATPPRPTIPTSISDEWLINPFMRVQEVSVQSHVGETDPVETMHAVRAKKDNFKSK